MDIAFPSTTFTSKINVQQYCFKLSNGDRSYLILTALEGLFKTFSSWCPGIVLDSTNIWISLSLKVYTPSCQIKARLKLNHRNNSSFFLVNNSHNITNAHTENDILCPSCSKKVGTWQLNIHLLYTNFPVRWDFIISGFYCTI